MTDAFGVVAMVAMTPLITIQILGLIYQIQEQMKEKQAAKDYTSIKVCIENLDNVDNQESLSCKQSSCKQGWRFLQGAY